jgi:phosphinothricin acetyltransferase
MSPSSRTSATIRSATSADAAVIAGIYNHYVLNTSVTFEEEAITAAEMAKRIGEALGSSLPWLVAVENGTILGYAYASKWKARSAYRHSAEATVYLAKEATGRGFGTQLYTQLIDELRLRRLHVVIGGVALPNEASVALHAKLGFQKVAHFKEVGRKFGHWIDVGYWQLFL